MRWTELCQPGRRLYVAAAIAAIGVLMSTSAQAQDFELHPGWIEGTIQLGGGTITNGSVWAQGCHPTTGQCHSASTQLVVPAGGGNTATYRLTVEGGVTYTVYWYLSMGDMSAQMSATSVAVDVGETELLNRLFPDWTLGTVHGTATVTGGTLQGGNVNVYSYDSATGISSNAYASISPAGEYSLTVGPGQVSQYASVYVSGSWYSLPYKTFTLAAGGSEQVDYALAVEIDLPGWIEGTISVNGDFVDYFYVNAYGPSASRYAYVYGSDGSFRFDDLTPGHWTLYAYAYDTTADGGYRNYTFPYTYTQVTSEQGAAVDFQLDPAFIDGTVTLGNYGAPYSSYMSVYSYAQYPAPCCQSAGFSRNFYGSSPAGAVIPESVPYELFVAPNVTWSATYWYLSNYYYGDNYSTSSYNQVYGSVANAPNIGPLDPGEHATLDIPQLDFTTGTLTLRLRVAGGGQLSSPHVSGSGNRYDAAGHYLYSTYAYGNGQVQQTDEGFVGTVKLTLAPGTYTFDAYAYVQGSWTSFGRFTTTIEAGSDVEQDISAPTLTVNTPPETCDVNITVTGTATDPSGVAYVKVNGVDVALDGSGNWSVEVTLSGGSNTIVVEAADAEGNEITVTRTINRLGCSQPPVADAGGPYTTTEGTVVTLSAQGSSDPDGDTLTFEWDLDGDGVFETAGVTVSFVKPDDFSRVVTLRVSDGEESATDTASVVVTNVAPTASVNARAMVAYDAALRFAGQPGDTLCLQVTQGGAPAGGGCATRQAGSPNEQLLQASFSVNLLEPYSAVLTFNTADRKSGATPVWWAANGGQEKIATFVTRPSDPSTYHQTLELTDFSSRFSAAGRNVVFSGSGSDPGADSVAMTWAFGDGGSAASSHAGPGTFEAGASHSFSAPGSYDVVLTVADDDGGTASDQVTVTIP